MPNTLHSAPYESFPLLSQEYNPPQIQQQHSYPPITAANKIQQKSINIFNLTNGITSKPGKAIADDFVQYQSNSSSSYNNYNNSNNNSCNNSLSLNRGRSYTASTTTSTTATTATTTSNKLSILTNSIALVKQGYNNCG